MADYIEDDYACPCGSGEDRDYCGRCNKVSDEEIAEADEFVAALVRATRAKYFSGAVRKKPSGATDDSDGGMLDVIRHALRATARKGPFHVN